MSGRDAGKWSVFTGLVQLGAFRGPVVGPGEHARGECDVADRVAMARRGGIDHSGALVVVSVELFGDARR